MATKGLVLLNVVDRQGTLGLMAAVLLFVGSLGGWPGGVVGL